MTGTQIYDAVKYWLPVTTFFTVGYSAYRSVLAKVTIWGNKLLENHLKHIQSATEESAKVLKEVRDNQISQGVKVDLVAAHVAKVANDLEKHEEADGEVQHQILTALEVLKDRT